MRLKQIIKITKGKYSSTLEIGYDNVHHYIYLHFVSHKKKKFWTRKHPTGYQFDNLIIDGVGGGVLVIPNQGKNDYYRIVGGYSLENFSGHWKKITVVNFKSNRCWVDNNAGTATVTPL